MTTPTPEVVNLIVEALAHGFDLEDLVVFRTKSGAHCLFTREELRVLQGEPAPDQFALVERGTDGGMVVWRVKLIPGLVEGNNRVDKHARQLAREVRIPSPTTANDLASVLASVPAATTEPETLPIELDDLPTAEELEDADRTDQA